MVTAGQCQAVKDTLSRPNVRSLTTSDTHGNPTTSTAYSNYITTNPCNSYTTTNDTAISLPDTMLRYSWYSNHYVMTLATAYSLRSTIDTTISYIIQQAIKPPFPYWYNKLVRPYTTIDTARLRYVTTLPSIQQAIYYYVTTSQLIPQAITFLYPYDT
jgi:hypothetical protein